MQLTDEEEKALKETIALIQQREEEEVKLRKEIVELEKANRELEKRKRDLQHGFAWDAATAIVNAIGIITFAVLAVYFISTRFGGGN